MNKLYRYLLINELIYVSKTGNISFFSDQKDASLSCPPGPSSSNLKETDDSTTKQNEGIDSQSKNTDSSWHICFKTWEEVGRRSIHDLCLQNHVELCGDQTGFSSRSKSGRYAWADEHKLRLIRILKIKKMDPLYSQELHIFKYA